MAACKYAHIKMTMSQEQKSKKRAYGREMTAFQS